jgi:hypothetical protein
MKENKGVTIPWNIGLKHALSAKADVVCISNSDVVYGSKVVERCAEEAVRHGVCYPHSVQGGPKANDFYEQSLAVNNSTNKVKPTSGFAGWCFFLSREAVEKTGPFDEQFTLWYQDTDYNIRVRHAGYSPVDVEDVLLHHYESRTIVSMPNGFSCYGWRQEDEKRFFAKWKDWGK